MAYQKNHFITFNISLYNTLNIKTSNFFTTSFKSCFFIIFYSFFVFVFFILSPSWSHCLSLPLCLSLFLNPAILPTSHHNSNDHHTDQLHDPCRTLSWWPTPISPQHRCPCWLETHEPTKSQNQITLLKSKHITQTHEIIPQNPNPQNQITSPNHNQQTIIPRPTTHDPWPSLNHDYQEREERSESWWEYKNIYFFTI